MASTAQLNAAPRCQHVHYSGRPCKAPARRGRNYCLFHQAAYLDAGGCVLPIIEDSHSYQLAVIRIARALADDLITPQKATALLYALQLAGCNLKQFVADRRDIEDPDSAECRRQLSRFLAQRLQQAGKLPTPTAAEIQQLSTESPAPDETAIQPATETETETETHVGCPTLTAVGRVGTPNVGFNETQLKLKLKLFETTPNHPHRIYPKRRTIANVPSPAGDASS